ncbi:hypothetical protein AB0L53_44480 [Nonomuraea sp. NPDC052129]|uniref:hypothetical protein n=1 Tax=Nonomuraea sp. NPDC052129 TaxID=3154651 RepID=UPI00343D5A42
MSPEHHHTTAVFVDQSGRRRRLIMIGSIASGVLALALLAVVIGGLFSNTTLSVTGWPGDQKGGMGSTTSPDPSPTPRTSRTKRPTPSVTRASARPTPSSTRPAVRSKEPVTVRTPSPSPSVKPSTEPAPEPTTEPTVEPVAEPTDLPPGQNKTPPGLDPDRTKGPKK